MMEAAEKTENTENTEKTRLADLTSTGVEGLEVVLAHEEREGEERRRRKTTGGRIGRSEKWLIGALVLGWLVLFLFDMPGGDGGAAAAATGPRERARGGGGPGRASGAPGFIAPPGARPFYASLAPGRRSEKLQTSLLTDVMKAFREGGASGLVDLPTTEEWNIFEAWRKRLIVSGSVSVPTLFFVGQGEDGSRRYRISFGDGSALGIIRLKKFGTAWHLVGLTSRSHQERSEAAKRDAVRALLSRLREREER